MVDWSIILCANNHKTGNGTGTGRRTVTPRHIEFLKHLLKYCKYSKMDRLMFHTHDGPTDKILQLRFQCDADLGGNLDNGHSQTSYIGYLDKSVICWCSTDQGSVSTSTAESEIKAVNHTFVTVRRPVPVPFPVLWLLAHNMIDQSTILYFISRALLVWKH